MFPVHPRLQVGVGWEAGGKGHEVTLVPAVPEAQDSKNGFWIWVVWRGLKTCLKEGTGGRDKPECSWGSHHSQCKQPPHIWLSVRAPLTFESARMPRGFPQIS